MTKILKTDRFEIVTAGVARAALAAGFAAMLAVTGCTFEGDLGDPGPTGGPVGPTDPADRADTVGAADSECPLPVTFEIAEDWEPAPVEPDAELAQGGLMPVCEIDAKPAGVIGYLRVWTGDAGTQDPGAALDSFLHDGGGEIEEAQWDEVQIGGVPGVEVTYVRHLTTLDERKQESAFAVSTPEGMVVLTASGFDTEEYQEMLPAYQLARDSAEVAG